MLGHWSFAELAVLLVIILVLVRPRRITDLAASLGKTFKSFKHGLQDKGDDDDASPSRSRKKPTKH